MIYEEKALRYKSWQMPEHQNKILKAHMERFAEEISLVLKGNLVSVYEIPKTRVL
jgi:hypothetical protein